MSGNQISEYRKIPNQREMIPQLKTFLVAILAIAVYHYRSQFPFLKDIALKTETIKNQDLISKFCEYHTQDKGITHMNPKHKPRKFYHEDYEQYFNVFVTHKLITDESIKHLLDAHDIYQDEFYLKEKQYYDELVNFYGLYLEKGTKNDRRVYVAFVGPQKGYGAFAGVDIPKGAFIGEYTGILTNNTANTDYAWTVFKNIKLQYFSEEVKDENGQNLDLMIDGRVYGNFLSMLHRIIILQDL